jgi:preprotein translocase subunit SecD
MDVPEAAVSHLDELLSPGRLRFREVLDAAPPHGACPAATSDDDPAADVVACASDGSEQYHLGKAAVVGTDVKKATAQQDQQLGQWQVLIAFTGAGQKRFTDLTTQLVGKRLAIELDGVVITAPTIQTTIDGDAQVTGSFTQSSAEALANDLSYGALPLTLHRL